MTTAILTLNAGSSSLKLALYPPVGDVPRELVIIQPELWVPEGIHCGLSCLGTLLKRCDYNRFLVLSIITISSKASDCGTRNFSRLCRWLS